MDNDTPEAKAAEEIYIWCSTVLCDSPPEAMVNHIIAKHNAEYYLPLLQGINDLLESQNIGNQGLIEEINRLSKIYQQGA